MFLCLINAIIIPGMATPPMSSDEAMTSITENKGVAKDIKISRNIVSSRRDHDVNPRSDSPSSGARAKESKGAIMNYHREAEDEDVDQSMPCFMIFNGLLFF